MTTIGLGSGTFMIFKFYSTRSMFIGILNKFILLLCPDESPIFKPSFTWLEKKNDTIGSIHFRLIFLTKMQWVTSEINGLVCTYQCMRDTHQHNANRMNPLFKRTNKMSFVKQKQKRNIHY